MPVSAPAPAFVASSPLLSAAYEAAVAVHAGPLGSGRTSIDHPIDVAALLHDAGYGEHVVAAALLHDVVEDDGMDLASVHDRFGARIGRLVGQLTEDGSEPSFARRKATLRQEAATDGHEAAAIFAADKLAIAVAHLREATVPDRRKREHYERSLEVLRAHHPEVPFLGQLASALAALRSLAR